MLEASVCDNLKKKAAEYLHPFTLKLVIIITFIIYFCNNYS